MAEPVDVYSDQFGLNIGAYGTTLNFHLTPALPSAPGALAQADRVATVRMSLQHLKVMAFVIQHQLVQYERQTGVDIQVPQELLNGLRIANEDWQGFWGKG